MSPEDKQVQAKVGRVTAQAVTHCLIATTDAFEGYSSAVVVKGIVDFIVTLLISEDIPVNDFARILKDREDEVLGGLVELQNSLKDMDA